MQIAVDATCWQNQRGYGRHARALLSTLVSLDTTNQYTFVTDSPQAVDEMPRRATSVVVGSSAPTALAAAANGHRSLGDMWRVSRALSAPDYDVLLFPTIYSYVPVLSRAKKVVVIHDVIAETYPHLTLPSPTARLFWRAKVALGRKQADVIVTVSEFSRRALSQRFGLDAGQIFVVGEASDPVFRRLDEPRLTPGLHALGVGPDRRLVVNFGGFSPHKNVRRLVDAFDQIHNDSDLSDVDLVLVGDTQERVFHSDFDEIKRQVGALGLSQRVIFTGFLPDEELVALLNRATVAALPSLMEGFGLPAIEAAACGCPVIATTPSPLPDLLGAGGIYVDPLDTKALAAVLGKVLHSESLRQEMRAAGLAAAGRLTWEKAAQQMMALFQEVNPI